MDLPKLSSKPGSTSGFGIGNIIGLVFVLIGILLVLVVIDLGLPIDLGGFETILEYGAALGSIIGGAFMLFHKKN
tara:strand:- start:6232 stop:6456 length:225 start_codon:yes stop_codon:yes gene_type:complete